MLDLVADRADRVHSWAGGIGELPVEVALAREDGTGVAAAHGDDDVGCLDGFRGERLGGFGADVDADAVRARKDAHAAGLPYPKSAELSQNLITQA